MAPLFLTQPRLPFLVPGADIKGTAPSQKHASLSPSPSAGLQLKAGLGLSGFLNPEPRRWSACLRETLLFPTVSGWV